MGEIYDEPRASYAETKGVSYSGESDLGPQEGQCFIQGGVALSKSTSTSTRVYVSFSFIERDRSESIV